MSKINIKRLVENIKANTTVYSPLVEVIVNAIQAIDEKHSRKVGKIDIRVCRSSQLEMNGSHAEVRGFEIEDNGIGFTKENRDSFDTLYSAQKIKKGGKGFGRFICLKYFENLRVESIYQNDKEFKQRKFSMGLDNDIIIKEKKLESAKKELGSVVYLDSLKNDKFPDKELATIAKHLVEKLLPFFISENCPKIILSEKDGTDSIQLRDYFDEKLSESIKEISIKKNDFEVKQNHIKEKFKVRVFKLYNPKTQKSRISLVAHRREVVGSPLHKYIPEFTDEFYEKGNNGNGKNYVIKAYVFGSYLDKHVSLERAGFDFSVEGNNLFEISQKDIESRSANIAREAVGSDMVSRQEKKKERVRSYVDEEAPWHKGVFGKIDFDQLSYNPSDEAIETILHKEKFAQEVSFKNRLAELLDNGNLKSQQENVLKIVGEISESSKNSLIHYVALRKHILDIFNKSLQTDESGSYVSEGVVHDIIFPRKGDTDTTSFEDHNLWIIDERLNFTDYVSSDKPLNGKNSDRPDLLVYDNRILFRGDNEPSNPVTIFEFKKPQRDDFANPLSKEDPVRQIVRYVNNIRHGKYKTPKGRDILVAKNTSFYGYVVCDLTPKVKAWLEQEKNFKPMPDGLGWFLWMENINLYIEALSWDKVFKDAKLRNQIFFKKLGI